MLIRGLSAAAEYSFHMVPIITDQHFTSQIGYSYCRGEVHPDISMTDYTFRAWTTPAFVESLQATTNGFDSVQLDWPPVPRFPNAVTANVLGYKILYRRALYPAPKSCQHFMDTATLSDDPDVNVFLTTGRISSAVISDLPSRNANYDFAVVPIISDADGIVSECFPYVGGDGTIESFLDSAVVDKFVAGHTSDVPDPHTQVVATAAPGALSVAYAMSELFNGGSPITSFRVTCTPEQGDAVSVEESYSCSGDCSSKHTTEVSGLTNGAQYTVTVAAANQFGWSAESINPSSGMPYVDCVEFVAPVHSDSNCHSGNSYGAVCEVECQPGFRQAGVACYDAGDVCSLGSSGSCPRGVHGQQRCVFWDCIVRTGPWRAPFRLSR